MGLFSFVTFVVLCIPILFNFEEFLNDFWRLSGKAAGGGHFGYTTRNGFQHFGMTVPSQGIGPLLYNLGLVGALLSIIRSPKRSIIVLVFPAAFFVLIGSSHFSFYRYYIPILPFVAIYLSYFASYLATNITNKLWPIEQIVLSFIFVIPMLGNTIISLTHNAILNEGDIRSNLRKFLNTSPVQPKICYSGGHSAYSRALRGNLKLSCEGDLDGVAFDSFGHEGYIYENHLIASEYKSLLNKANKVIYFSPYSVRKDFVTYHQKNFYSPWYNELSVRELLGPYIEIYLMNTNTSKKLISLCEKTSICGVSEVYEGYFRNRFRFAQTNKASGN